MVEGVTPVRKSVLFESPWLRLEALDMGLEKLNTEHAGSASQAPYYRVVEAPGVICVLLSAAGDFVMVRQPRPAVESFTLEFPAGRVERGESAEDAVSREVFEETGMRLSHLKFLGETHPIPSRLHSPQSLFIGVASKAAPEPVTERSAHMVLVPRDGFLEVMNREGMHCIVALGVIKLAELLWPVDLFNDTIDVICHQFSARNDGARKGPAGESC